MDLPDDYDPMEEALEIFNNLREHLTKEYPTMPVPVFYIVGCMMENVGHALIDHDLRQRLHSHGQAWLA